MALLIETTPVPAAHLFESRTAFSLNGAECHSAVSPSVFRASGSAPSVSKNMTATQHNTQHNIVESPMLTDSDDNAYLLPFLLETGSDVSCAMVAPVQWSAEDLLKQFNMVRITDTKNAENTTHTLSTISSYAGISPSCKRKRRIEAESSLRNSVTAKKSPIPNNAAVTELPQKKIKTMTVAAKQEIFAKWLELKACGMNDCVFEQSAIACAIGPQDLYEHFLEFEAQDLSVFDKQLRYERQSAERALQLADVGAWLLRRSSYNRRFSGRLILTTQQGTNDNNTTFEERELNLSGTQCMPQFYAFSYNKQPQHGNNNNSSSNNNPTPFRIAHLLLVHVQWHGWALADTVGNAVKCHQFFDSFLGLLGFIIDHVEIVATRRVGYEYDPLCLDADDTI